jgi:mono/diheme cytochrome c family protein
MGRKWLAAVALGSLIAAVQAQEQKVDPATGLAIDEGFELVKGQCTVCHSPRLITQSGKTREGWIESIRWMQRNQGLWDLGPTEEPIVNYLAKHYPVPKSAASRRPPLPAHLMPK